MRSFTIDRKCHRLCYWLTINALTLPHKLSTTDNAVPTGDLTSSHIFGRITLMKTLSLVQYKELDIPVHSFSAQEYNILVADLSIAQAIEIVGGLSAPSKMPGWSTSISAKRCKVGATLRKVKGSTCEKCYACKGMYNFPNVIDAMERRYIALSDPRWVMVMAIVINKKSKKVPFFRWHDSGDLQSLSHLINIVNVCKLTPNVSHWLPTREYAIVRKYRETFGEFPPNLVVRASATMLDASAPKDFGYSSEVATNPDAMSASVSRGSVGCVAPSQNNQCGSCRACWDTSVPTVTYHKH